MVSVALKREVEEIMERLPETATLDDLLSALQTALPEEQDILAQERDPNSELRQALNRGLHELDVGEGIANEDLMRSLGHPE
jgi:hypothetical protein